MLRDPDVHLRGRHEICECLDLVGQQLGRRPCILILGNERVGLLSELIQLPSGTVNVVLAHLCQGWYSERENQQENRDRPE